VKSAVFLIVPRRVNDKEKAKQAHAMVSHGPVVHGLLAEKNGSSLPPHHRVFGQIPILWLDPPRTLVICG
jgi:hypothetical protein